MKKLYFVRHGESEGNAGTFRQGPTTPLTELGMRQAKFVAKRFASIPIDKVFVSTYTRAQQTAEIINEVLKKEIEFTDLLIERIKPTSLLGKEVDDPRGIEVDKLTEENFHNPDFKFEDGETFTEMRHRALKVLELCRSTEANNILLVTHGIFLKMLAACAVMGEELTSHEYWRFYTRLKAANTSITVFTHGKWKEEERWYIESWNDSEHLG
jgi:probable phosphoglycerate mutase